MFDVGDFVYLANEIIEPACEDHPEFLMGGRGERVEILEYHAGKEYPWLVEGPTNKGKPWYAGGNDLLMTKPWTDKV